MSIWSDIVFSLYNHFGLVVSIDSGDSVDGDYDVVDDYCVGSGWGVDFGELLDRLYGDIDSGSNIGMINGILLRLRNVLEGLDVGVDDVSVRLVRELGEWSGGRIYGSDDLHYCLGILSLSRVRLRSFYGIMSDWRNVMDYHWLRDRGVVVLSYLELTKPEIFIIDDIDSGDDAGDAGDDIEKNLILGDGGGDDKLSKLDLVIDELPDLSLDSDIELGADGLVVKEPKKVVVKSVSKKKKKAPVVSSKRVIKRG